MRRGIHITVSILAVLLLLKPFDCFSSGKFSQKAADCCRKGKCVPSPNADDCCKGTLPGGKQLVVARAPQHFTPSLEFVYVSALAAMEPAFAATASAGDDDAPPGSPPGPRLNLPLLI